MLLQNLVFGVLVGGVYGVAAVGLSLVFGVIRMLNVAHGELIMLGGYASFWLFERLNVDPFASLPLAAAALVAFGAMLYWLLFRHVAGFAEEKRINTSLLIGFGLSLILQTAATHAFAADERSITVAYARLGLEIAGAVVPAGRLASLVVTFALALLVHLFLRRTFLGKAIRATAENLQVAGLMGIHINRTYLIAFALGSGLAGVAGTLVAAGYSISPHIGLEWTLKALVVVVLAGLGNVIGTFAAGLVLGVAETLGVFLVGGAYREAISLVLFVLVLMVRPQGLFGRQGAHP